MGENTEAVLAGRSYPFSVEVTKNTKGYNWVVKVAGDDKEKVMNDVTEIEDWAKGKYSTQ